MTPEEMMKRGTEIIQDFASFSPEENKEMPQDIHCLKLWAKAKLYEYGAPVLESEEMQAAVSMAIEAAYRLGRLNPYERLK